MTLTLTLAAIVLSERTVMRILPLAVVLLTAAPVGAQSRVYTNADLTPKPVTEWRRTVTPAELDSLRQHQYQAPPPAPAGANGPTVVVFGSSPTDGPFGAFTPLAAPRRLDGTSYVDPPWEQFAYVGGSYYGRRAPHAHLATDVRSRTGPAAAARRSTRAR